MGGANTKEIEDLTGEDRALSELLHGLKHVDAPANFETRVNARIAEGEPVKVSRWAGFQLPVYAASLAAILIFAALFVWMGGYFERARPVPAVAEGKRNNSALDPSQVEIPSPQQPAVNNQIPPAGGSNPSEVAGGNTNQPLFDKRNPMNRLDGNSQDLQDRALKNPEQPMPRGVDPNSARRDNQVVPRGTNVPIAAFLNQMGMEAGFQGQALKVSSVRAGSLADKTGVKTGDIIDAIGETKITPETTFGGSIQANSITVIRGGQFIKLKISI